MSKPVLVYIPTRGGDRSPQTNMKKTTCKNCTRPLTAPAEPEAGQWIVRCFECGAKNIIALVPRRRRLPAVAIAGWRD